ncbi:hypothetical protein AgCh_011204 [Apium graveolens]
MMILAVKAVFLLSLFSFLGTHARNLPEDILEFGWTSSITSIVRPPRQSPPPPQVNPPIRPIMSDKIIRMPMIVGRTHSPPPPAPYIAPPHDQVNAYQRWTSIFASRGTTLELSHFSQQVLKDNEIIKRPSLSPPPPPHLAPPHIQKEVY